MHRSTVVSSHWLIQKFHEYNNNNHYNLNVYTVVDSSASLGTAGTNKGIYKYKIHRTMAFKKLP